MDKITQYKKIARQLIEQYGAPDQNEGAEVQTAVVTDDQHGHYILLNLGWQDNHRTYFPYLHLDVRNGKIFVEKNHTEIAIAKELERLGVPKDDIVLAFHAPYKRQFSGYAVA